ncbi:FAD-dependent oxidoreductase [Rathayibacter sp. CAU 1779]
MRIAIVGAGIAGLASALLLDSAHEVTLFERSDLLGGHARTHRFSHEGRRAFVNPAFGYIAPAMYPRFIRLLELLRVAREPAPASVTVGSTGLHRDVFVTPTVSPLRVSPVLDPLGLRRMLAVRSITRAARVLDDADDWTTTLDEFLEPQPVSRFVKDEVVYPWMAAVSGVPIAEVKAFSARAALRYPVHVQQEGALRPFGLQELTGGVDAYVQPLLDRLQTTTIRRGVELRPLQRSRGQWQLTEASGVQHEFDAVVVATPAFEALALLGALPGADRLRDVLAGFPYASTRILVHSDTSWMPRKKSNWSVYNARHDGPNCEATIWCRHSGEFAYFKSWATFSDRRPSLLHAEFEFHHPRLTPGYYRSQSVLPALQGLGGLWFAGSYVEDVDSHESGIGSAIRIAERLNPGSANLAALR